MKIKLSKRERDLFIRVVFIVGFLFAGFKGIEIVHAKYSSEQRALSTKLKQEEADYRQRLATINEEEQLQQEFAVSYQQFVELGVIGAEPRLNWIETLQEIARKRRFYDVSYSIASRISHAPDSFAFTRGSTVSLQSTGMNFRMPMLHDLDFMMFLEDYSESAEGTFVPLSCNMTRVGGGGGILQFQVELRVNFEGECQLEWLSVEDPDRGNATNEGSEEA